tara:strand:+ start:5962 stop:6504 length:543 start_codon:yes stop_codon:yes gene_type:complete
MKKQIVLFICSLAIPCLVNAQTYNDYIIELTTRVEGPGSSVQDMFGNPQLVALAEAGDVRAQYDLGMKKFHMGDEAGLSWLDKAADQGHVGALFFLGGIYTEGVDAPRDLEKAFTYIDSCSKLGNYDCSFYLGLFYEEGLGGAEPNAQIANWYLKEAAISGVDNAIEHLCKYDPDCDFKQ